MWYVVSLHIGGYCQQKLEHEVTSYPLGPKYNPSPNYQPHLVSSRLAMAHINTALKSEYEKSSGFRLGVVILSWRLTAWGQSV